MGFVALFVLGGGAFAALVLLRVDRALWSLVGAALCLGGAGYAWQGSPLLAASPARGELAPEPIAPEMIALRDSLLGRFTQDTAYLIAADAMTRVGDRRAAAQVALGGVAKLPRSFITWTWLGVTLAAEAGDNLSPPALLAFRQAARLAPEHPAPPFYLGLAYVKAGQFAAARAAWARALALCPAGASYRAPIAARLALLDRLLAAGVVR